MMEPISLYFHIPFCRRRCIYCDFYSGGVRIADWNALSNAFIHELEKRRVEWQDKMIVSLYFGGGTPSLMPADDFENMIINIRKVIGNSSVWAEDCEITIEVNPEDVDETRVQKWKRCGINRVSLGIQTFDDKILAQMGRTHTEEEAIFAFTELRKVFKNISTDLIFGLPGQNLEHIRHDLDRIMILHPTHVSVYSLMYEPHTALTHLRESGKVNPVGEDISEEMFQEITSTMIRSGYERYETSNYALPGYESRHNSGYWTGRAYVGIGPAAHSYDGGLLRKANPADIKGYLSSSYNIIEEYLTTQEMVEERIMLGLRMKKGIDLKKFMKDFGKNRLQDLIKKANTGIRMGNLEISGSNLRITEKGLMISDTLIVELF